MTEEQGWLLIEAMTWLIGLALLCLMELFFLQDRPWMIAILAVCVLCRWLPWRFPLWFSKPD